MANVADGGAVFPRASVKPKAAPVRKTVFPAKDSVEPKPVTVQPSPVAGVAANTTPTPASTLTPKGVPSGGYTLDQIKKIWVNAGGDPRKADEAAAIALATSGSKIGSRKSGANQGLWGVSTARGVQPSTDPMTNARAAIALSKNGTSWKDFPAAIASDGTYMGGNAPATRFLPENSATSGVSSATPTIAQAGSQTTAASGGWDTILSAFSLDTYVKLAGYAVLFVGGCMLMITGGVLVALTNRKTKATVKETVGTVLGGLGFGVGAQAGSAIAGAASGASNPPDDVVAASPTAVMPRSVPRPLSAGGRVHTPSPVQAGDDIDRAITAAARSTRQAGAIPGETIGRHRRKDEARNIPNQSYVPRHGRA